MIDWKKRALKAEARVHNMERNFDSDFDTWKDREETLKARVILKNSKGFPKRDQHEQVLQADRVVWRIIKDWLFSQFSLIEIGQAKPLQIFLPYAYDGRETFYEKIEKGGFKGLQLEAPKRDYEIRERKTGVVQDAVFDEDIG